MIFIVLLLLVLFVIYYFHTLENFRSGIPSGYGYVYSPQPPCKNKNNCYPGYYFRTEAYNNCPQFTALGATNTMTKFKKPLTYFK